jgi:hypothetical protein
VTAATTFKPGDVVRYDVAERHCREGMAIAKERAGGGVVLVDTFWQSSGEHVLTDDELTTAEMVFNLADYDELDRYWHESAAKWKTYAPADRETITSQHGLQVRWFVRKGALPDLQTQIENACEAFLDAQTKLRSAEFRAEVAWRDLAELEARR